MSTTTINFTMKDLDGTVIPFTSFVISTSATPSAATFTTNLNGQASVVLTVATTPYFISKQDGTTESVIAYKFFVPTSVVPLEAEMLFVDMGKISTDKDTKSIAALIEAKVVAVSARNQALQLAQVLGTIDNIENSLANVTRVEESIDNVDRVFTSIDNVDRVATSADNVDRVHTSITNIDRVFSSISNVDILAPSSGNIDILGPVAPAIDAVADVVDARNLAVITTIPTLVSDVQTARNTAVNTTIPADVNAVDASRIAAQAAMAADVSEVDAAKNTALAVGIPAAIATVAAINNRGDWAAVVRTYALKDIVKNDGTWYMCVEPHSTTTGSVFATDALTKWRVYQGVTGGELGDETGALFRGAALVGYNGRDLREQLDQVTRIENIHALRDFYKALFAFNTTENSTIAIATYGDSVSSDIGGVLGLYLLDLIGRGFGNLTTFGTSYQGVPIISYAGGAALSQESASATSLSYLPTGRSDTIPVGGSAIYHHNGQTTGFVTIKHYLATIPGGGTATVELLAENLSVLQTQVIDTSSVAVGCVKAEFTGLDVSVKYRLRVTASAATVISLGIAMLRPRGLTSLAWMFGGTTLELQNSSPKAIFDFINLDLGVKLFVCECKGESPTPGGYPGLIARLNALSTSVVFVGSRPDVQTAAVQLVETHLVRQNAVAAGYAYIDAGHLLKNYAELARLGWGGDGTHLPNVTAYYVASCIFNSIPVGALTWFYNTRPTINSRTVSAEFALVSPNTSALSSRISFAENMGGGNPTLMRFHNVGEVHFGVKNLSQRFGGYTASGIACFVPTTVHASGFGDLWAKSFKTAPGSTDTSTFYSLSTRSVNLLSGSTENSTLYSLSTTLGMRPGPVTFANLPATAATGTLLYVSNALKIGQSTGSGSGCLAYMDAGNIWRRVSDDTVLAA